jgi:hypothetical protein
MLRFNREKLMVEKENDERNQSKRATNGRACPKTKLVFLRQFMNKAKDYINQEEIVRALVKSKVEIHLAKPSSGKVELKSFGKKRKEEKTPLQSLQKKKEP